MHRIQIYPFTHVITPFSNEQVGEIRGFYKKRWCIGHGIAEFLQLSCLLRYVVVTVSWGWSVSVGRPVNISRRNPCLKLLYVLPCWQLLFLLPLVHATILQSQCQQRQQFLANLPAPANIIDPIVGRGITPARPHTFAMEVWHA